MQDKLLHIFGIESYRRFTCLHKRIIFNIFDNFTQPCFTTQLHGIKMCHYHSNRNVLLCGDWSVSFVCVCVMDKGCKTSYCSSMIFTALVSGLQHYKEMPLTTVLSVYMCFQIMDTPQPQTG